MARLPTPGGDDGTWGDVLNQFLLTSHNSDGTVRDNAVQDALPTASNGQVMTYNGVSGQWEGQNGGSGDPTMGGDLSGTASNAQIVAGAVADTEVAAGANIAQSKIANLTTDLAGKANTSHTHAIADTTNLQASLDAKVDDTDPRLADERVPTDGSVTALKLANSSVTEPKLDVANTPNNGQVLSWNGTNFSWVDQSSVSGYVQGSGITKITVGTTAPGSPVTGDVWINT